ncbi:TADBP-like protein [Mya arenaria]|uniref:TADBP-like protein n=1 Tax=Mya arenaria TaxID=6604 RepID=A0ABY7ERY9_MYAAR|nr:TAR DNA-binding protein 43-like isoform X1 [Mya arenaria]WAR11894.1 TADBP-like protein [Mya arenaria]
MTTFVRVTDDESELEIEIPTEEDGVDQDGTILLTSLVAQFPGACGLKYRSETGGLRGVRLANGSLYPPGGMWGDTVYIVNFPKESKRKVDEELENPVSSKMKKVETRKTSDLIVLGLPWKSTEDDMKAYFEQFGDLVLTQVKRDPRSGQSKGFGFIKFKDYEAQLRCLAARHRIDGRWCEVNLPNSHTEQDNNPTNRKIFVARCTEDLTNEELREYFEQFGEVVDVFIPKPFRAFAFVTFADPLVAERLCGEDHIIKTASVHISSAEPKAKEQQIERQQGRNRGGNFGRGEMWDNSGSGQDAGLARGNNPVQNKSEMNAMGIEPNMNNIGMNMFSSAMLAAAQAVFQGAQNPNSSSYELGPGFGGTRDSRSGGFNNDSASGQNSYSQWGNRSGGGGGYNNSSSSSGWGQGASGRGNWN